VVVEDEKHRCHDREAYSVDLKKENGKDSMKKTKRVTFNQKVEVLEFF